MFGRRRSAPSCRPSSRRRSSTRKTACRSRSRSARRTPTPRSSIPASSSSAAAPSLLTVGLADIRGVKVDLSLQPVRLLGRGRHLAARDQDAQGSRRQGPRRREGHDELRDVRLVRAAARRRYLEVLGRQHRDAGPCRLRAGRPRRPPSSSGSRPTRRCMRRSPASRRSISRSQRAGRSTTGSQQHSLSRRRRAYRLGREAQGADPEALCRLQGRRRMDRGASRRSRQADRAQGHGRRITRRSPTSFAPTTDWA